MKKLILGLAAILAATTASQARTLRLMYIAHDVTTPVEEFVRNIEEIYTNYEDEADSPEDRQQTIVYLSSGENPFIVNMKSGDRDDHNFNVLLSELYERNYHDVDAEKDVDTILELLANNDYLTPDGSLDVSEITIDFYINKNFWTMGMNESVIATLFYSLGFDRYIKDRDRLLRENDTEVNFRVYFPELSDKRDCISDDVPPFGENNVNNINELLKNYINGSYN